MGLVFLDALDFVNMSKEVLLEEKKLYHGIASFLWGHCYFCCFLRIIRIKDSCHCCTTQEVTQSYCKIIKCCAQEITFMSLFAKSNNFFFLSTDIECSKDSIILCTYYYTIVSSGVGPPPPFLREPPLLLLLLSRYPSLSKANLKSYPPLSESHPN